MGKQIMLIIIGSIRLCILCMPINYCECTRTCTHMYIHVNVHKCLREELIVHCSILCIPGREMLIILSNSILPCKVARPTSARPVAAISYRQKTSSPQIELACCSRNESENVGSKNGMKSGR